MTDVRSAVDGGASGTQLRFFIDRTLANEPRHWLSGADVDCHGYCARIEKRLHGREYVLVASGLQVNFELWTALSRFLRGLFAITGIPPYTVEADSFLGNYHSTVFGIHRDKVGVLMSVVEGYKRMRFWLPDELTPADATRRRHRYGSLLPRALTIEARPGDLVYWPANFWHVAEPAGPSLSLHVGLGTHGGTFANPDAEGTPSERIVSAVRDLFGPDDARPLPLEPRATDSIRDARRVARIFSGADAAYRQLAPLLVGRYLSRVTAVGFDPPPPPLRRSWLRDGTVRANGGPLLWRRLGRTIVISANGHAFTAPFMDDWCACSIASTAARRSASRARDRHRARMAIRPRPAKSSRGSIGSAG